MTGPLHSEFDAVHVDVGRAVHEAVPETAYIAVVGDVDWTVDMAVFQTVFHDVYGAAAT